MLPWERVANFKKLFFPLEDVAAKIENWPFDCRCRCLGSLVHSAASFDPNETVGCIVTSRYHYPSEVFGLQVTGQLRVGLALRVCWPTSLKNQLLVESESVESSSRFVLAERVWRSAAPLRFYSKVVVARWNTASFSAFRSDG